MKVSGETRKTARPAADRGLAIEHVAIEQLRPDPVNPRRISDDELEALTRSIREFGFVQPVIARRDDGTVVGGHQRLVAARKLGYTTVPVVFVDLPLEQARVLNLALNKISGEWDEELLARLLADLSAGKTPAVPSLTIEYVPIEDLRPDNFNPRRISDDELEALTRSIREFGFVQPMVARHQDRTVVGGHQRLVAARKLGYTTVPVIFVDLPLEQARLLNLALNKISGEWDEELLARLLADLSAGAADLTLSGFDDNEVKKLLRSLDHREKRERPEAFDLDAALEAARAGHDAKKGDLWALGEHRLLCGDAADPEAVAHLMDGQRAQMTFTDPPYNVSLGDHGGQQRGTRKRRLQNDALPKEQWETFCRAWSRNLLDATDGAVYICMSTKEWPLVSRALEEESAHWSDTIIWVKDRFVIGRADYQRCYEPVWFGWREGARHFWCGGRDQSDVWHIARPSVSDAHPTMKPIELVERAIENSSRRGDIVLDLFLGSGSTLIAAERTGRISYGMELDPHYAQVAVLRWEAFTGLKAKKRPVRGKVM